MNAFMLYYLLSRCREPCDEPCDCCTEASSDESEDGDLADELQTQKSQPNRKPSAKQTTAGPSNQKRQHIEETQATLKTEDKFDVLGKYVASRARQLEKEQRTFVERIIHEAIFEGQMGNLNINSQLVVNTETFVSGPSDYAKKTESDVVLMKQDIPGIKIEIDLEEEEEEDWLEEPSENEDVIEDDSQSLDGSLDSVSNPCSEPKKRRLEEPDEPSELLLKDVVKVEIVTDEHENLESDMESEYITSDTNVLSTTNANISTTNTNISTTNANISNPQKINILDEPETAASHSQQQTNNIKLEVTTEENWNPQEH